MSHEDHHEHNHEHCCDHSRGCSCHHDSDHDIDPDDMADIAAALVRRIEKNQRLFEQGDCSHAEELADDCLTMAVSSQDEGDIAGSTDWFHRAIEVLEKRIDQGQTDDLIHRLGLAHLGFAVMLNDEGNSNEALEEYQKAVSVLTPLADAGKQDVALDLAGVELNIASILYALGPDEWSWGGRTLSDRVAATLARFEALDGTEARFYRAKTLMLQAAILEERFPADSLAASNEAANIFRALVHDGKEEYKSDLAESLAILAERAKEFFPDDKARLTEVLTAARDATKLFHEFAESGNILSVLDEVDALLIEAYLLEAVDRSEDALDRYEKILDEVRPYGNESVDILTRSAECYSNRAKLERTLERYDEARGDWGVAIELYQIILEQPFDQNDEEQADFISGTRLSQMLDRIQHAEVSLCLGDNASAAEDCHLAEQALNLLSEYLGDDYAAYRKIFDDAVRGLGQKDN